MPADLPPAPHPFHALITALLAIEARLDREAAHTA